MLDEPASVRAIADELVVSESAVKKLLGRCYDKFGLDGPQRRRGQLALEAIRRGGVSLADLESR
jgi:DNA-binding NarL/FixJ family response regulator